MTKKASLQGKTNSSKAKDSQKTKNTDSVFEAELMMEVSNVSELDTENTSEPYVPFDLAGDQETAPMDAIYGSYTEAELRALLTEAETTLTTELEEENIIGGDERIRILRPGNYFPYRAICALRMVSKSGRRYIGTGYFVGPRIVITAGHCMYFHGDGGWAKSIEVIPALDGNNRPFGSCVSTYYCSLNGWTRKKDWNYDFGIIVLPSQSPLGNKTGWFGYSVKNNTGFQGLHVMTAGYPGDKGGNEMWYGAGRCVNENNHKIAYKIDTYAGQSGSPVWVSGNYAVAIHTNGSPEWNFATKISGAICKMINDYKKNFPG